MMITFGPKTNRRYSTYFNFLSKRYIVDIYFHKNSTYLGINIDHDCISQLRHQNALYNMYRDVNESSFSTFLSIKNLSTKNLSIINQFDDIKNEHKDKVQYLNNECVKVAQVVTHSGKKYDSLLYIYMLGMCDYKDIIYIIYERQHIDQILNKKVVRSCAIQIATKERISEMVKTTKFIHSYNTDINNLTL